MSTFFVLRAVEGKIRSARALIADAFLQCARGPATHSDRRPNEEGRSVVLIAMWTHMDVPAKFSIDDFLFSIKLRLDVKILCGFVIRLRMLHEPLSSHKSAILLRQLCIWRACMILDQLGMAGLLKSNQICILARGKETRTQHSLHHWRPR